jgi:hypothetical protein
MNERSLLQTMRATTLTLLYDIEQGLERCNLSECRSTCTRSVLLDGYVFHAEAVISGVLINPALPDGFDNTPLDARSDQHRQRWLMRPFIETVCWFGTGGREAEERRVQMLLRQHMPAHAVADLEQHIAECRQRWFATWPAGIRYELLWLDGKSSDCPSSWGQFATLEEALERSEDRKYGWPR